MLQVVEVNKDTDGEKGIRRLLPFWPIALFAITGLVGLGGIFVKLDYIEKAINRNDQQFAVINDRQNLTSQTIIGLRSSDERQIADITRLDKRIDRIEIDMDKLKDTRRWTPK